MVQLPAPDCSGYIPLGMRAAVPGATLPARAASVGGWVAFADAQTGQLDKANANHAASLEIIGTCEQRYDALVKAVSRKPWWRIFG